MEFTGRLRNPYSVMSACDCFVMSSDYEGQPIVILEARVLGLPIVTTRFGSVHSAMEGSGGLIVDTEDEALADGMQTFLEGTIFMPCHSTAMPTTKRSSMNLPKWYSAEPLWGN